MPDRNDMRVLFDLIGTKSWYYSTMVLERVSKFFISRFAEGDYKFGPFENQMNKKQFFPKNSTDPLEIFSSLVWKVEMVDDMVNWSP